VPITRYCDEHHLTPRQRLELFVPVCSAVQHAHQKGVIHRDLKPSNVLVALYDGKPVPKVIDFGIAKAAGEALTDRTRVTGFGAIIGTLEYMSPEQAQINQLDIDTRSDIYALGVLLYELLTGSTPFSRKELERAGVLEMLRVIREQEPSKPSAKLSTAEGLPTLAADRGTEPTKLIRLVRGELDWIVMKALEKDRGRRYDSANGFAADVQRHLADEPVQACPPSVGYRLRKFLWRNRGPVLAVSFVGLALVGGVIGTTWGLLSATAEGRAKDAANTLLLREKDDLGRAERQAQVNLSTLLLDRGLEACEQEEVGHGLLLLVRSLEEAPADAADLQRVIRINLAAWSHQTSHLRGIFPQESPVANAFLSPDGTTILIGAQLWDTATGRLRGEIKGQLVQLLPGGRGSEPAFTPDGKRILTTSVLAAAHGGQSRGQFYDTATCEPTGKPLPFGEHPGPVAFSADSKVVLTTHGLSLRWWDVTTGQPLGKPIPFAHVSFSRDRRLAITVAQDSMSARLWDTATGQPIGQPLPLHEPAKDLAFSFDGSRVLTQGDSHARLWDTATAQEIGQSLALPGTIKTADFSLDGKTVALVGDVRNVDESVGTYFQLWDAATGIPQGGLTPMDSAQDRPVFVGSHLFTLGRRYPGPRLSFGRLADPHRKGSRFQEVRAQTRGLALTSGGPLELVTLEDGTAQIWNTYVGEPVGAPLPSPHAALFPVFSSDLRTYVIPGIDDERPGVRWDGIPRLWKVGEGKPHGQTLPRPDLGPTRGGRVAFSPDARFLLRARSGPRPPADGPAASLDLCDKEGSLGRVTGGENDEIGSFTAAFSPDGRLVLASVRGKKEGDVGPPLGGTHLWAAEAGKLTSRWEGIGLALAFSPDGKQFAEGGAPDKTKVAADRRAVRLWDVATLKPAVAPLEHPAPVHALAFGPDGKALLTACGNNPDSPLSQGGEARLWDAATGQPARSATDGSVLRLPHQGAVLAVAFSPDGKTVLTGSSDWTARLWDAATGQRLGPPLAHQDTVTSVAYSPDGRQVLTASRDGTSRLWDAAIGKPLGPPLPLRHWDTDHVFLAFGPDEQSVLTAGKDGELTRWQVEISPVAGDVERIRLWVQVLTGKELDQDRVAGDLSHETWNERRRRLEERGGPPLP
jgi:WD40 repeat protein